jgi:type VI secretion system secreted protein Hcp
MAGSMWVKIEGCEGEATDDGHQKEIDITSYSFGVTHPVSFRGGGLGGGEASVQDVVVAKLIDKASPILFKFCMNHKVLPEVLITQRKRGEDKIDYIKIKLKNAVVSSVSDSGNADTPGSESIMFAFEGFEQEYTPQGSDGKPQGAVTMKWDIKQNKEG